MTTALEIAELTVQRSPVDYVRGGYSYCQTFAGNFWETFFGRATPNSYGNATQAYNASTIVSKDYNAAPPGAYHYFTYGKDGHVGVSLGSGYMASGTGWATNAVRHLGKHVYIHKVADYAAHLPYLGWSYTNGNRAQITGLTDAFAAPVAKNQRKVGGIEARRRTAPATSASYDGNANLAPGTVVTPAGWVNGESVDNNKVWFKIDNLYSHSGGFTDARTHDLTDLNVYPNRRTVGGIETRVRSLPNTSAPYDGNANLAPGATVSVEGYARGEKASINGVPTDIWYKVPGGWAWGGAFTVLSTSDLTEIQVGTPEQPGDVLDPTQPWKNQTPDSSLATWVGSPNYNRYPSNPVKTHITLHWMAGTLAGTDATFQKPGTVIDGRGTGVATNYGIGLTEIHQYIKEKDYQHGDGNRESNTTGISIEHEGGYSVAGGGLKVPEKSTLDLSAKLCADIAYRNGLGKLVWMENVYPHSHWTSTSCPGTLDYQYIIDEANRINGYDEVEEPEEPETPTDLEEIERLLESLQAQVATLVAENVAVKGQLEDTKATLTEVTAERDRLQGILDQVKAAVSAA